MNIRLNSGFNQYEQVTGAADAIIAEAEWLRGVTITEEPSIRIGSNFAAKAPIRAPKPTMWQRFVNWLVRPEILDLPEYKDYQEFLTRQAKGTPFDKKYPFL